MRKSGRLFVVVSATCLFLSVLAVPVFAGRLPSAMADSARTPGNATGNPSMPVATRPTTAAQHTAFAYEQQHDPPAATCTSAEGEPEANSGEVHRRFYRRLNRWAFWESARARGGLSGALARQLRQTFERLGTLRRQATAKHKGKAFDREIVFNGLTGMGIILILELLFILFFLLELFSLQPDEDILILLLFIILLPLFFVAALIYTIYGIFA